MSGKVQNDLISIIVPVYNVGQYLDRCVQSLLKQTYRCIEIILVDDGSTDGSGERCDELASFDERIIVIHKDNGGLSDARNAGIETSAGQLLTFVDSDDWVLPDYVQTMYDNMREHHADISGCHFQYATNDDPKILHEKEIIKLWTSEDAIKALLQQDGFTTSAWGLLIDKQLFHGISFPKGKYYEDLGTVYKLLHKANLVVHTNQVKYLYFKRPGSIQSEKYSVKHYDELVFIKEINNFVRNSYPDIEYAANERMVGICFHLILMMSDKERRMLPEASEMKKIIKNNRRSLVFDSRITMKVRGGCLLSYCGIGVLEMVYKLFGINGRIDF